MLRNVGGQAIGSQVNTITTGGPFVGEVKVYITGDGGIQALGAVNGGVCEAEGNGYYSYKPSQAETNFGLIAFTFIGGGSIPATVQVVTVTPAQEAAISTATITTVIGDGPTRIELLNQLAHRLNKTPPPNMDSSTEARLGSYLNQRHRRLLSMPGMARLRDATITLTSVAEQADYGLPNISKISRIFETTNERALYEMSMQDYRLIQPLPMTGTPEAFVWRGRAAVAQQPLLPSALFVSSSSPDDVGALVYVEGIVAGGATRFVGVALSGTTPVNIASIVSSWERVDKFYLAVPVIGEVTLTQQDGPTLAVIPAGEVSAVHTALTFYPTPSDAVTYYIDITRVVTDIVRATDQALIPPDFADLLVLGALADEYQHLADTRWTTAMTEYKERENQLKYWLSETAIGRPFGLARQWQRPSQLGSWYPAGS